MNGASQSDAQAQKASSLTAWQKFKNLVTPGTSSSPGRTEKRGDPGDSSGPAPKAQSHLEFKTTPKGKYRLPPSVSPDPEFTASRSHSFEAPWNTGRGTFSDVIGAGVRGFGSLSGPLSMTMPSGSSLFKGLGSLALSAFYPPLAGRGMRILMESAFLPQFQQGARFYAALPGSDASATWGPRHDSSDPPEIFARRPGANTSKKSPRSAERPEITHYVPGEDDGSSFANQQGTEKPYSRYTDYPGHTDAEAPLGSKPGQDPTPGMSPPSAEARPDRRPGVPSVRPDRTIDPRAHGAIIEALKLGQKSAAMPLFDENLFSQPEHVIMGEVDSKLSEIWAKHRKTAKPIEGMAEELEVRAGPGAAALFAKIIQREAI